MLDIGKIVGPSFVEPAGFVKAIANLEDESPAIPKSSKQQQLSLKQGADDDNRADVQLETMHSKTVHLVAATYDCPGRGGVLLKSQFTGQTKNGTRDQYYCN